MLTPLDFYFNDTFKNKYHMYLIGSRAYGTSNENSDWDFLIYPGANSLETLVEITNDLVNFGKYEAIATFNEDMMSYTSNLLLTDKLQYSKIIYVNDLSLLIFRRLYGDDTYTNSQYTIELIHVPHYGKTIKVNWIIPENNGYYNAHIQATEYLTNNFDKVNDLVRRITSMTNSIEETFNYKNIYDVICYWFYKHSANENVLETLFNL